jgi:outer membrane protein with beta-barrel domain
MDENLPNRIDKLFNDALQKFKGDPSEYVWDKIEEKLDGDDRKIVYFFYGWKKYVAVAILLFVGLGFLLTIYNRQETIFTHESSMRNKADQRTVLSSKKNIPAHDHENSQSGLPDAVTAGKPETPGNGRQKKNLPVILTQLRPDGADFESSDSDINLKHKESRQTVESHVQLVSTNSGTFLSKGMTDEPLTVIHPKKRLKDRLSVTPYFSQEFAGYSLTDNDLTGVNGQEIEERERNVFSASIGFFINYQINKRWVLQSGISYSWSNSNIDSATSYAVKDNNGNVQYKLNTISGYGYLKPSSLIQPSVGDSVSTAKSFSQLHYLSVPLVLSYQIPFRRFSLLIGGGVSFNMLTGAEIETKTYGHGDPEKEYTVNMMGLKKVNYGMLVKLDLEYHLNSKMGVNIIPCFKNTLSPINLQSALTAYPYNFGIGVGFTYRF